MRAVSLQEVEVRAGAVESVISKLGEVRGTAATSAEQEVIGRIRSGQDELSVSVNTKGGRQVYGGALEGLSGRSLVVCASVETAREIGEVFCELGVKASIAHNGEVFSATSELNQGIVIAPLAVVLNAYREAKASHAFERCVVDSADLIVRNGSLSEIEAMLTIILELRSDAQLVLIGDEPSQTVADLGARFLRNSKTCPTKGAKEQTMEHVYYEVGTSLLAKPQALCDILPNLR
jgi:hypothetical protein